MPNFGRYLVLFLGILFLGLNPKESASENAPESRFTDKLILAQVVFRHGDRSPLFNFPNNNINFTEAWPRGYGQLTSVGEVHSQELGQFLRDRYSAYLKDSYHPDELRVLSSATDRTVMTALSVLQGLYPSRGSLWSPVPLQTIEPSLDNILCFSAECPRYESEMYCHRRYGEGKRFDEKYAEFYNYVAEQTGHPCENMTLDTMAEIYDTLRIQAENKFVLPEWSTHEIQGYERHTMRTIAEFAQLTLIHNEKTMILRGGPLLREMIRNVKNHKKRIREAGRDFFKLYLYSGHDTTVAAMLHAFGVHDGKLVPFTGAVMFELFKRTVYTNANQHSCDDSEVDTEDYYYVKVFYRRCLESRGSPEELFVPKCNETLCHPRAQLQGFCELGTFLKLKMNLLKSNWARECVTGACSCDGDSIFGSDGVDCSSYSSISLSIIRFLKDMIFKPIWGFFTSVTCALSKS